MLIATTLCAVLAVAGPADDALTSRELAGIAEEQALLTRQLGRLKQTMEVLALRLEAEGRPRAVELLREGLELLNLRAEASQALTLEESMEDARERIQNGQVVQSLDRQAQVIEGLQHLLAILMERGDLDDIEAKLERLLEMKQAIEDLSSRERELLRETRELREDSTNAAQRELEEAISRAQDEQRRLLEETEREGRRSGALELEQLEAAVRRMRTDLGKDAAVAEAWTPSETETLERATTEVERARTAEDRARRLDRAAQLMSETAAAAGPNATPEEAREAEAALERELDRAERHARASGDPAAQAVAEGLRAALENLRSAREGEEDAEAAARAAERTAELREQAEQERAAASESRDRALDALSDLAGSDSVGGMLAREAAESLHRAQDAAEESGDRARSEAAEGTEAAARSLKAGLDDLERMGEALSGSQEALAQEAERLERGLNSLEAGRTEPGERAAEALEAANEALRQAAQDARSERPVPARDSMEAADRALAEAESALGEARQNAGSSEAAQRAAAQRELGEQVAEMRDLAREGSMSPSAERETSEALDEAAEAMEQAASELEANRGSSAAEAQREAQRALDRAGRTARDGVQPSSPEDRARAEELAAEQEAVRKEILELATREDERRNPTATRHLRDAGEQAQQASESLEEGDLGQAEESEEDVQRELDRAMDELEKEEEQYEKLRQEELLFRITEEVRSALEAHTAAMEATREIDAQMAGRDRPSRAQKIRLRKLAREEEALAERAGELAQALAEEQSLVFTEVLRQAQADLGDIALDLGEQGDWDTGERTQAKQRDVQEALEWLYEALQQEQRRREEEQQQEGEQEDQQQQQQSGENRLVPDAAELKLLRRMEVDVQESLERLLVLYPELADEDPADVNPLILDDINRLAIKHERTTELFQLFRSRLGLPEPASQGADEPENDR